MTAQRLDGRKLAKKIEHDLAPKVRHWLVKLAAPPGLWLFLWETLPQAPPM